MQSDKPVDPRVADFFIQKGSKAKLLEKLGAQGYPVAQFESVWPRLVASMAFSLASEVLKDLSEESKKTISGKAPGTSSLEDLSVFGEYFLAIIDETKKWPEEKLVGTLDSSVENIAKQVIEGYQSVKKYEQGT